MNLAESGPPDRERVKQETHLNINCWRRLHESSLRGLIAAKKPTQRKQLLGTKTEGMDK